MEFEFDDDDEIVTTSAPTAEASAPSSGAAAEASAPTTSAAAETSAAPAASGSTSGLLLEFDDEDEIVSAEAGGGKRPAEEAGAGSAPEPKRTRVASESAAPESAAAAPAAPPSGDFEAASAYAGPKAGYVFQAGAAGLGYYRDWRAVAAAKKAKKKKKAVSFRPTERAVDGVATVKRVCDILLSLKTMDALARKGPKCLQMLTTLARTEGCVTAATAAIFMSTLRAFASNSAMPDGLAGPMGDVVEALGAAPKAAFELDDRVQVATWRLSLGTARTLRETDDTYDFCGAMKRVSMAVAALQADDSDAAAQRRDAIIHCLKSAWPHYLAKKWAKTPVEAAVLACAERRHCFSDTQRGRLDKLTTQVKSTQRGLCKVDTATVRDEDSTFHPLLYVPQQP